MVWGRKVKRCNLPNRPKYDDLSEWKACRRKKKQINDDLKRILIKVGGGETGWRLWKRKVAFVGEASGVSLPLNTKPNT